MGSLRDDRIQSLYLSLETAQHLEVPGGMGCVCVRYAACMCNTGARSPSLAGIDSCALVKDKWCLCLGC